MKIVIANRRYFESGGPERYFLQIIEQLQKGGHDAIPFSVRRKWNLKTPYDRYFVSPPAGEDALYYRDYNVGFIKKVRILLNAVYSFEARRNMDRLIREQGVDLLYLLGIVNDISSSVIDAAKKNSIPVVLRASDFNIFCPQYLFMRNARTCTECEDYGYKRALKYRCLKDSLAVTGVRVLSMYMHRLMRVYSRVDAFVAPSVYMRDTFIKAGFPEEKVHHIQSFFNADDVEPCYENDGYILYFGRVDANKGVINLIKAYEMGGFSVPLHIVGASADGEDERLMAYVRERNISNVKFISFKNRNELVPIIQRSIFAVVPSVWPDNSPMTVLEAMSCGKPVIGSDLGGISEQITPECGILVPPYDPAPIAKAMERLLSGPELVVSMGMEGHKRVKNHYSIKSHYDKLLSLFSGLLDKGGS